MGCWLTEGNGTEAVGAPMPKVHVKERVKGDRGPQDLRVSVIHTGRFQGLVQAVAQPFQFRFQRATDRAIGFPRYRGFTDGVSFSLSWYAPQLRACPAGTAGGHSVACERMNIPFNPTLASAAFFVNTMKTQ